jgi:uncharacterized repeat protein (TIGR02543 family)
VSATGLVTAVSAGSATITVSAADGSKTATCTVSVSVPTASVIFNANSGSGTVPSAQTASIGSNVTLPNGSGLTRSGYTFGGWNTNTSGTGTAYKAGDSYTVTANVTLYAKWDINYTVTYNVNGGSGTAPTSQTAVNGSTITLSNGSGLSRTFYTFGGWNTNTSGTGTAYKAGDSYTVTGNVTLYAKWDDLATIEIANFVRIVGGTFTMGSPYSEPDRRINEAQHLVTVSSFYMGKYQVTQAEYEIVMGENPSYFKGSNLPVEMVSWYDAVEYCNRLSQIEGLTPVYLVSGDNIICDWDANGYRLPTESEWEYACRAGTTTPFNTGININTNYANFDGKYPYRDSTLSYGGNDGTYRGCTTPVGSFAPNPWGLYDMHGNVWEWCWDWFGNYSIDPLGATSGVHRVARGGCWVTSGLGLRSAYRGGGTPSVRNYYTGFRLVRH